MEQQGGFPGMGLFALLALPNALYAYGRAGRLSYLHWRFALVWLFGVLAAALPAYGFLCMHKEGKGGPRIETYRQNKLIANCLKFSF